MTHDEVECAALTRGSKGKVAPHRGLRAALACGVAVAMLAGAAGPAGAASWFDFGLDAQPQLKRADYSGKVRKKRIEEARKDKKGQPEKPPGPLHIIISIGSQRVSVYSNGVPYAQSVVSTGVPGHPTPTGIFSVIQKHRFHHSNIYSSAPMPYMQRITWSGVALHEGIVPGRPASHGCIRLKAEFARRMWGLTRIGARVIIARSDVAPVEIAHPRLFERQQRPAEVPVVVAPPDDAKAPAAVRTAEATITATDATKGAGTPEPAKASDPAVPSEAATVTGVPEAPKTPDALKPTITATEPSPTTTSSPTPGAVKPDDAAKPKDPVVTKAPEPPRKTGPITVYVSRKLGKLFVRQGFEPLFEAPVTIERPDQPLGTHIYTAVEPKDGGAGVRWVAVSMPGEPPPKAERLGKGETRKLHGERDKRAAKPKPPAELHPPETARGALDRIEMPQDAVDRISELLSPGSSLILSDHGISGETGKYTDFIVLTR